MKTHYSLPSTNEIFLELSNVNNVDATKYTLYEVLADPNLDKLTIQERLNILSSWEDDMKKNKMLTYKRYSLNGCAIEKDVFDLSDDKVTKMLNFGSNDYLNMSQHPA